MSYTPTTYQEARTLWRSVTLELLDCHEPDRKTGSSEFDEGVVYAAEEIWKQLEPDLKRWGPKPKRTGMLPESGVIVEPAPPPRPVKTLEEPHEVSGFQRATLTKVGSLCVIGEDQFGIIAERRPGAEEAVKRFCEKYRGRGRQGLEVAGAFRLRWGCECGGVTVFTIADRESKVVNCGSCDNSFAFIRRGGIIECPMMETGSSISHAECLVCDRLPCVCDTP